MTKYLYIIQLTSGKCYIGITGNLTKRWQQHCSGNGAKVCKIDKPDRFLHTVDLRTNNDLIAKAIENYVVMLWAEFYGISSIIGGIYIDDQYREATRSWVGEEKIRTEKALNRQGIIEANAIDIDMLPKPEINYTHFKR